MSQLIKINAAMQQARETILKAMGDEQIDVVVSYSIVPKIKGREQIYFEAETIINVVSGGTNVSINDLTGKSRLRDLCYARMVAMHLIRKYRPTMSLKDIGRLFQNRDHSTIIHALRCVEDSDYNPVLRNILWSCEKSLLNSYGNVGN